MVIQEFDELLGEIVDSKMRYQDIGGADGFVQAIVSGILGNWMVGMAAFMATNLADLFRQVKPDEQTFSWWDYRGGSFHRKHGLRIDFLLGTPAVAQQVKEVYVDREFRKKQDGLTASDHAPVIAELEG